MGDFTKSAYVAVLMVLLTSKAFATPSSPLYIDDSSGNIGTVDLSTDTVHVLGNSGQALTDIGFTSNGNLYGTSFDSLYSINKTNGAATLLSSYGGVGGGGMNALVGNGTGLYAASTATNGLYSVGVAPFSIFAFAGSTGGPSAGDLAFASSGGSLYETQSNGNLAKLTLSGGTVNSVIIGNTSLNDVFGLATGDDGTTYAVAGTVIYKVNLSTAALTPLFDYSGKGLGDANGTAFISEALPVVVPEPGSLVMLFSSLLGLSLFRVYQSRRH